MGKASSTFCCLSCNLINRRDHDVWVHDNEETCDRCGTKLRFGVKSMIIFDVYCRYGMAGHVVYLGQVKAVALEEAFENAKIEYKRQHDRDHASTFYVRNKETNESCGWCKICPQLQNFTILKNVPER